MQNYSTTQGGNLLVIAAAIALIFSKFGITLVPDDIVIILTAVGVAISWYGRYKKGDLTLGGFRK